MVLQLSDGFVQLHPMTPRISSLQDLKLKMEFLAATDVRQVKLPKLSRETKRGPALVKIGQPFEPECAPEICKTDVNAHRPQFHRRIKRKWSLVWHEAGE